MRLVGSVLKYISGGMYVTTMCGLIVVGSLLLPFPITFWCNSIHCQVSIVIQHGRLTLAQGIEVDNWLCIWSAPTCTNTRAWQVKLASAQGGPVNDGS